MMRKTLLLFFVAVFGFAGMAFAQGGYGGPSMLSRGGNLPGKRGRAPVDITLYGGLRAMYEARLTPVQLNQEGDLLSISRTSMQAEIGAYGGHSWRKTTLGLDYRGDYRRPLSTSTSNPNQNFPGYLGTNQALSLQLQHQLTRRISIGFTETAGTSNRAFGGFAAPAGSDVDSLNLVNNEVFDSRTHFTRTGLMASYQHSARTSFFGGANHFAVRRVNRQLISTWGHTVAVGAQYRLTRKTSIGAQYMHFRFYFPRAFAGSEAQGGGIFISRSLFRNADFSASAALLHLRNYGTQQVQLSPEVAAILGQSTSVAAFERTRIAPQMSATIGYTLERSRLYASAGTGITPGNGVFLTAQTTTASVGYSYTGIRNMSMGLSANYSRRDRGMISIGTLTMYGVGGGINYRLGGNVNLSSQLDYRTFNSSTIRGREGYSASLGITISSVNVPLSIW